MRHQEQKHRLALVDVLGNSAAASTTGRQIDFDYSSIPASPAARALTPRAPSAKEIRDAHAAAIRLGVLPADGVPPLAASTPPPPSLPSGPEPTRETVEYLATGSLLPLADPAGALSRVAAAQEDLDPTQWLATCELLLLLRQLAVHHAPLLAPALPVAFAGLLFAAVKSARSAVAKSGLLALQDVIRVFAARTTLDLPLDRSGPENPSDSFVHVVLLKAAGKDRFLAEEAVRLLAVLAQTLPLGQLLDLLLPYARAHRNPRVRGKAATAVAAALAPSHIDAEARCERPELCPVDGSLQGCPPNPQPTPPTDVSICREFGCERLVVFGASVLTDRDPESREAARSILRIVSDRIAAPGVFESCLEGLAPLDRSKVVAAVAQ